MAEEVKLTRKERCQQKKEEKKARRQAEKEFERSAGRKAPKILSLIFGIVGFLVGFIPVILLIFTLLFVIICGFASVVLFIIDIFGLLCFGLGYLIYASQASDASLSGYFAPAAKPIEFGKYQWRFNNRIRHLWLGFRSHCINPFIYFLSGFSQTPQSGLHDFIMPCFSRHTHHPHHRY